MGVVSTKPGFLQRREVVEVEYDPKLVSFVSLMAQAKKLKCMSVVFTRTDKQQEIAHAAIGRRAIRSDKAIRPAPNPKRRLRGTS